MALVSRLLLEEVARHPPIWPLTTPRPNPVPTPNRASDGNSTGLTADTAWPHLGEQVRHEEKTSVEACVR